MFRVLVLFMLLASSVVAKSENMNKSLVNISDKAKPEDVHSLYLFAVSEYEYANYGIARDIFTAIAAKTSNHPGCYFFLGKIYDEVAFFKDKTESKQWYLKAAVNKNLPSHFRQDAYASLIRLTDDSEVAMKYAEASYKLGDSDNSKVALILAYHKKYDKTKDESYLDRAEIVNRSMTDRFFSAPASYTNSLVSGK